MRSISAAVFFGLLLTSAVLAGGNDCNNNGVDDATDIADGTSPDCNTNGIPDECEPDADGDGVPDDCDPCDNTMPETCTVVSPILAAPPHDVRKHRYISIDPRGADALNVGGLPFDIRVELTNSLVNGVTAVGMQWWANPPDADCISLVGPTRPASPPDWSACPTLHVGGCPVIPTSTYEIVAVAGATASTPPLIGETQAKPDQGRWFGDVVGSFDGSVWTAPQGVVTVEDVLAVIRTVQDPSSIGPDCAFPPCTSVHVTHADIHPHGFDGQPWGTPNQVVNLNDIFATIIGFQGSEFPGFAVEMCPDPSPLSSRVESQPGAGLPERAFSDSSLTHAGYSTQGARGGSPGPRIRFIPIRSAPLGSPAGTVGDPVTPVYRNGCWEYVIDAGGVDVDIAVEGGGWGNVAGNPVLSSVQATVDSAGYDNGIGAALNPKGWPASPEDGAYLPNKICDITGDPCVAPFDFTCDGSANGDCVEHPDWILADVIGQFSFPSWVTLNYAYAAVEYSSQGGATDPDPNSFQALGGLILEVPVNAAGRYVIAPDPDPDRTLMITDAAARMPIAEFIPACIAVCDPLGPDTDGDGVPDVCDVCSGGSDTADADGDSVGDGCDVCPGGDDTLDADGDGVPDACDVCAGGDDNFDADGDGVPDDCDICPNGSDTVDSDGDGVFDGCEQCPGADDTLDADGDGVPDACDRCPGADDAADGDGDGLPDACDSCDNNAPGDCSVVSPVLAPSPHDILKNRYISIDPRGAGAFNDGSVHYDIKVKLVSTLVNGVTAVGLHWWANPPDADCVSLVGSTQPGSPPDWSACPILHMTGCPIIPTSSYEIVSVIGNQEFGPVLSADTQARPGGGKWWADVVGYFDIVAQIWTPPQGSVNADDVVAAIKTYQNPGLVGFGCGTPLCNATHVSVTDVHPAGFPLEPYGTPNRQVDINDVYVIILGFQGNEYPGPEIGQCLNP